eukprot:g6755.t1
MKSTFFSLPVRQRVFSPVTQACICTIIPHRLCDSGSIENSRKLFPSPALYIHRSRTSLRERFKNKSRASEDRKPSSQTNAVQEKEIRENERIEGQLVKSSRDTEETKKPAASRTLTSLLKALAAKITESREDAVKSIDVIARTSINMGLGIGLLTAVHCGLLTRYDTWADYTVLLSSYGATAALLFAAPDNPVSQPRAVLGGHVLSAACGVTAFKSMQERASELEPFMNEAGFAWCNGEVIACPLAVMMAVPLMLATRTFHPPAAGTAVLAVQSPAAHTLGFVFCASPVATSSIALISVALLVNNVPHAGETKGPWPKYWW